MTLVVSILALYIFILFRKFNNLKNDSEDNFEKNEQEISDIKKIKALKNTTIKKIATKPFIAKEAIKPAFIEPETFFKPISLLEN
jgi:hypothetical protein